MTNPKTSEFKCRRELLISGYVRENYQEPVPVALLSLITQRYNVKEPQLLFKVVKNESKCSTMEIQVKLDRNPNKLLNIVEYHCDCRCIIGHSIQQCSEIKSKCSNPNDIKCTAKFEIDKQSIWDNPFGQEFALQFIGLDKNGNKIIAPSRKFKIDTRWKYLFEIYGSY